RAVITGLQGHAGPAGIPEGLTAAGEIQRAISPRTLGNIQLHAFTAVIFQVVPVAHRTGNESPRGIPLLPAHPATHPGAAALLQGVKPPGGIAIPCQPEGGTGRVKCPAVKESDGLTTMTTVISKLAVRLSDIRRSGAPGAHVDACAQCRRLIFLCVLSTSVSGHPQRQPP